MGTGMGLTPDAGASHRPEGAKGFRESRVRSALSSADALVTAGGAHWSRTARTFVFENRCFALDAA